MKNSWENEILKNLSPGIPPSRFYRSLLMGIMFVIFNGFGVACSKTASLTPDLPPTSLPTTTSTISLIDTPTQTSTPEPTVTATPTPRLFIESTPTQSTRFTPKPGVVINAVNAQNLKVVASWYADTGVDGYPYWLPNSGDIMIAGENKVTLFDKTTFSTKEVFKFPKIKSFFTSSDGEILAILDEGKIFVFDKDFIKIQEIYTTESFTDLSFSNNGNYLAASTSSGKIIVWDLENLTNKFTLEVQGNVPSIGFSMDGSGLYILTREGAYSSIQLWSFESKSKPQQIFSHEYIYDGIFLSESEFFIAIEGESNIQAYDLLTKEKSWKLYSGTRTLNNLTSSRDEKKFAALGEKGLVLVFGLDDRVSHESINVADGNWESAQISPDGSKLLLARFEGTPRLICYDLEMKEIMHEWSMGDGTITKFVISTDNQYLGVTTASGRVFVLQSPNLNVFRSYELANGEFNLYRDTIYFVPLLDSLITGSRTHYNSLEIINLQNMGSVAEVELGQVYYPVVSRDSRYLAFWGGGFSHNFWIRDIVTYEATSIATKKMPQWWNEGFPSRLEFSPDSQSIAYELRTSSGDPKPTCLAVVYNLKQKKDSHRIPGCGKFMPLRFSPDGSVLAHGNDKVIDLFNLRTNVVMATIVPDGQVTDFAFSPNNDLFVYSTLDGSINVVELETLSSVFHYQEIGTYISKVDFSPDGKMILFASSSPSPDYTLRLLQVSLEKD